MLFGAGTSRSPMEVPLGYILMARLIVQEMEVPTQEAFLRWLTLSCATPGINAFNMHWWIFANFPQFGAVEVPLSSCILIKYYEERCTQIEKGKGHNPRDDNHNRHFTPEQGNSMGLYFFILLRNLEVTEIDTVQSGATGKYNMQSNATLHGFHRNYAPRFKERLGEDPNLFDWQYACRAFLQDWFPDKKPNLFKWKKKGQNMILSKEEIEVVSYKTTYQYASAVATLQQFWYLS